MVVEESRDWQSNSSLNSSASDVNTGSPKKPLKTVSGEIHLLKHELARERTERMILEATVQEHQKLIELLSNKLDRQSLIILSLQQSVEMFSRPQRIAAAPSPAKEHLERKIALENASHEDDEDEVGSMTAPRKSKSARALTQSSSIHRASPTPHAVAIEGEHGNLADSSTSNRMSPTPGPTLSDHPSAGTNTSSVDTKNANGTNENATAGLASSASRSHSKSSRRKSTSNKELTFNFVSSFSKRDASIDASPSRTRLLSDASSSSDTTTSVVSKKDSKDSPSKGESAPTSQKEEKRSKDKEKRKSSRKSIVFLSDSSNPGEHVATQRSPTPQVTDLDPKPEWATSSSPAVLNHHIIASPSPVKETGYTSESKESKREKRKSKRGLSPNLNLDDSAATAPGSSSSAPSISPSTDAVSSPASSSGIQFNSNPSIIPNSSSRPKRVKLLGEKKPSTLRGETTKKDAMTDVEDYTVTKKRRKVRRTLSDPDQPENAPTQSKTVDDIVPVITKKRSKRKSERVSDRSATGDISVFSGYPSDRGSDKEQAPVKEKSDRRKSEKADRVTRRKSSPSPVTYQLSASPASQSSEKKKYVRLEGVRRDSSASESFEPLSAEAAHEASSPEYQPSKPLPHITSPQKTLAVGSSSHAASQFRQSSRKLEMEEENILSLKRREVTSPRPALNLATAQLHLDLDRSLTRERSGITDSGQVSPSTESTEGTRSGHSGASAASHSLHIPSQAQSQQYAPGAQVTPRSGTNAGDASLALEFSSSNANRTAFEQERDSREATMLSPRGRELSGIGSPAPLTSRGQSILFLSNLPCNDIGIPIILEQLCKYLLAEGTSSVALFEKRVDFARLENLRRKLDQTVSNASSNPSSNSKTIASAISKDLKGEDPYVVAGVLKRWFLDLPDTLLMSSKSRYWLDVVEITDDELCISGLQTLYYSLDLNRRRVLRFVLDFLKNIIVQSNGITTIEDVSTRFGPLLLRLPASATNTPHLSARGEGFTREHSGIHQMVHSNSSSNLSGSTDDTMTPTRDHALTGSTGVEKQETPKNSAAGSSAAGSGSPAFSIHTSVNHAGRISRRGSARLDAEATNEIQTLSATLVKYLINHDSEIVKNHDQGIEFSRRPDLSYVVRCATQSKILMLLIDQNYTEREFSQIVWDTCVYFTKPKHLLAQFIGLYDKARGELRWQNRMRMRILMAIKTWIKHSNFSLGNHKEFRALLQQFSTEVMAEFQAKEVAVAALLSEKAESNPIAASPGGGNNPSSSTPGSALTPSRGHAHQRSHSSTGGVDSLTASTGIASSSSAAAAAAGTEVRILHSIMNASMFERSDDTWIQWKLSRLSSCEPFTFEVQKHDPSVIAGQLAMVHCRLFAMIHPSELTDNAPLDPDRSPNYTGVVQHINCVTSWVAYDILYRATPTDRARILVYWLDVAECLLHLGDFLGCWAIRGAFDLHPLSRMSQTWERVSRKDSSRNKRLASLFDPRMNFAEYRKAFDNKLNETSFGIPILAFLPKDIIRLETSEPTFPEPGLVDVDKLRSIYYVLQNLSYANMQTFCKLNAQIKPISTIWDFFSNLPVIQESTLDQLSYKAEPRLTVPQSSRRTASITTTSPSRPQTDR
jgi:hypothetical protein